MLSALMNCGPLARPSTKMQAKTSLGNRAHWLLAVGVES